MNALDALVQIRLAMGEAAEPYVQTIRAELERGQKAQDRNGTYIGLQHHQDALAASQEECRALRDQLGKLRAFVWRKDIPHPTIPEYREHHEAIQKILVQIDSILGVSA